MSGASSVSGVNGEWSDEDLIAVAASHLLEDGEVCFVGIGLPSAAALLARRTRTRELFLVYESGTLGTDPQRLPLSVADDALAGTALSLVSVPEMFNYWLQGGNVDVGLLGAGQVDRFGNVNSTVVGEDYDAPKVRLPGAGGAPEIASAAGRVVVMIKQTRRSFVDAVDFITTVGQGTGGSLRRELGFRGAGTTAVVTDIGLYEPHRVSGELTLTALHPGRTVEQARAATPWELVVADGVRALEPPTAVELDALRRLRAGEGTGSA